MKILIMLLFFSFILSTTLIVPTDYPTIQAGFDAAADGDTVLVLDGTYSGEGNIGLELNNDDRALVLISENGPENCIIDCQGQNRFISVINSNIYINGLKICNGFVLDGGGAIYSNTNSRQINISNCVFSNNQANVAGAIYIIASSCKLDRCIFENNSGGTIISTIGTTLMISHCLFYENSTQNNMGTILACSWMSSINSIYNSILLGSIDRDGECTVSLNNSIYPADIYNIPIVMPDPLFVDPDNNDFHLQVESPAINVGTTDLSWPDDSYENYFPLDPDGTQPDIGVYPYFLELQGDTNFDGEVDVTDIVQTVNIILGLSIPFNAQYWACDFNADNTIDVLDIVLMVEIILE